MREVVKVAGFGRVVSGVGHGNVAAGIAMWLLDAQGRRPDLRRLLKGVAHVVEENKTKIGTDPTQGRGRGAQLQGVHEHTGAADWIAGLRIARSSRINGETAMRG